MVGLIVRLRWALAISAVRRNRVLLVSLTVGVLAALVALAVALPALVAARGAPPPLRAVVVPVLTMLTLLWTVLALVTASSDQTLDAGRFAVLPVRPGPLAAALAVAAATSIPSIALTLVALGTVVTWSTSLGAGAVAVVAAPLAVATTVLLSRVTAAALGEVMRTGRGRIVGGLVLSMAPAAPGLFVLLGAGLSLSAGLDSRPAAEVAGAVPLGWAWSAPWEMVQGRPVVAVVKLVMAAGLLAGVYLAWGRLVARELTRPLRAAGGHRVKHGPALTRLGGVGPAAAVATRRLRAWRRDSRLVNIVVQSFFLPLFLLVQSVLLDTPSLAGLAVVSLSALAGLALISDLAFDGPAWWTHLASGMAGARDRAGRALAAALLYVPVVTGAFVGVWVSGLLPNAATWAPMVVAALPASAGVALVFGAYVPGVAPPPGGNPFASRSGGAAAGCLGGVVTLVAPPVVLAPVALAVAVVPSGRLFDLVLLAGGLLWGMLILVAGVVLGGRRLDARGPEILGHLVRTHQGS